MRWSVEKAEAWYRDQPWLVGCNFVPSTAINQLEMWQAETFDATTVERELGWAADLGFNTVRVYLHDLVWQVDAAGFKSRIERFLQIATGHGIRTTFVLFDDCWNQNPKLGSQPGPVPGLHNSGWLQSPGLHVVRHPDEWGRLKAYVQDILHAFGTDERVLVWDLYNEPGNYFLPSFWLPGWSRSKALLTLLLRHLLLPVPAARLLREVFAWAWEVQPAQPLTAGLWYLSGGLGSRLNKQMLALSDVVSFHCYEDAAALERLITRLKAHGRPLLCTEYMARQQGSLFATCLPVFERARVGCYNWGLVKGKTQTIFPWGERGQSDEPDTWFHDILRADGTPYDRKEVEGIRLHTGRRA